MKTRKPLTGRVKGEKPRREIRELPRGTIHEEVLLDWYRLPNR